MDIHQALVYGSRVLFGFQNPRLESEVLLAWVLRKPKTYFRTNPDYILSISESIQYFRAIRRRARHIPTAYIMGYKIWNNLKLRVTSDTLIPRDETEILIQSIKDNTPSAPHTILDVGTGSGAIAIAMAHHYPEAKITALDISHQAKKVAEQNARAHKKNIHFIYSDLLEHIPAGEVFDIIIANLPYVPEHITVTPEVKKEPYTAIFAPEEGLHLIKKLRDQIQQKHIQWNDLWLEFLPIQKEAIKDLFSEYKVLFHTDIAGDIFFAQIHNTKPRKKNV